MSFILWLFKGVDFATGCLLCLEIGLTAYPLAAIEVEAPATTAVADVPVLASDFESGAQM